MPVFILIWHICRLMSSQLYAARLRDFPFVLQRDAERVPHVMVTLSDTVQSVTLIAFDVPYVVL